MDTFSSAPTFPRTQSMQLVQGDHQFQIILVANCLTILELIWKTYSLSK
jgi:hypothetical protein